MQRRTNGIDAGSSLLRRALLPLLLLALGLTLLALSSLGTTTSTAHASDPCFELNATQEGPCDPCIPAFNPVGVAATPGPCDPCAPLLTFDEARAAGLNGSAPDCEPAQVPPGSLTVTKVVDGGPAAPSDFSFVITAGGAPVTGV